MDPIRLLVISGSARAASLNLQLAGAAAASAQRNGAAVTRLDLRALALPLYDGDIEAASGVPAGALALLDAVLACDAVLVVSPEYNGFPPPLLINAFDWLSRVPAQAGPLGGLRAMNSLRQYLQMAFAMIVVPQQFALGRAGEAFDDAGGLKEAKAAQAVDGVVQALERLARALKQ